MLLEKYFWIIIISNLSVIISADSFVTKDLILNYFTEFQKVDHLLFISKINDIGLLKEIQKDFNSKSLWTKFFQLSDPDRVKQDLDVKTTTSSITGVYLNITCDQDESFLKKIFEWNFFNTSYAWLIDEIESFPNVNNIRIDSNIKVIVKNGVDYELRDVFNVENRLINVSFAEWNNKGSFILKHSNKPRNLQGSVLKTGVYVNNNENNITDVYIEKTLNEPRSSFETLLQLKYFNSLNFLLSDVLSFRQEISFISDEIGNVQNIDDTLYGCLKRNECDLVSSGAFISAPNDTEQVEFIYSRFWLDQGLYYLLTSEFTRESDLLTFLTPLARDVWIVFTIFVVIIAFLFKLSYILIKKFMDKSEDEPSVLINMFEIITNQGLNDIPQQTSVRLVILSALILMLLLFNLYSASLLTVILMPPTDPYHHVREMIASDIQLSRYNDSYAEYAFKVKMDESSQKYQNIFVNNGSYHNAKEKNMKNVLVFNDGHTGVLALRDGLNAFGGESSAIESAAGRALKLSEICNLKRQTLIYIPMYMVLSKGSQYKEMFKIVLLRAIEVGILDRILKMFKKDKGLCLTGVTLTSVTFSKVRSAFYMLGGGVVLSLVFLLLEILWYKFHKKLYEAFEKLTQHPVNQTTQQPFLMDFYYMP